MSKSCILWAFKWNYGGINIASIKPTRRETLAWTEKLFEVPFRELKKQGHSIVKVELKEVKP